MKWTPLLSAFGALGYITVLVTFFHYIESVRHETPDTLIDGIGAISVFVLSAAVMGYLFFYYPIAYIIEGKTSSLPTYFLLKTIGYFAIGTIVILTLVSLQSH
jgi:hypothetical protein